MCRATTQSRRPPPIQSREARPRPGQHPDPLEPAERGEEGGKVVAVEERDPPTHQRGDDENLEAAQQELGGEEKRHRRGKSSGFPAIFRQCLSPSSASSTPGRTICGASASTCPHRALIVVTGPSGSGKSTLAFDTLYAEGQRRYIESLSTYAKQFLDRMPKPLVDRLEGLAPAVAIEQRNPGGVQPLDRRAPPPRCTTTCGCSGPASARATAGCAAGRCGGTRPRRPARPSLAQRERPDPGLLSRCRRWPG